jgi:hypothetical protein
METTPMNASDAFAIETAQTALKAALKALDIAYGAVEDVRIEELLTSLTSAIEEGNADLGIIAAQIEDDRDADAPLRPWFRAYAAA